MTMRRFRRQRRRPAPTTDRRPPEERLDAMLREPNQDRRDRTFSRIRNDLEAGQDVSPWVAAVSSLRDRLIIGESESCYLAWIFAEATLFKASQEDGELVRIAGEMDAIESADGLSEDDGYTLDEAPPAWLALSTAWDARADALLVHVMRAAHLDDVATMYLERRAEFEERSDEGRDKVFPPLTDEEW